MCLYRGVNTEVAGSLLSVCGAKGRRGGVLTGSWSHCVDRLWLPRIWVGTDWDVLFLMPVSSLQDSYTLTSGHPLGT